MDYVWKKKTGMAKYTNLVTPPELREPWCYGLPLVKEDGTPMSDEHLETFIAAAVITVETRLGIKLRPHKIVCNPSNDLVEGTDYDDAEYPYDYNVRQYQQNWGFFQLRKKPVISVERMRMVFPNGQTIFDFPKDWIKLYNRSGHINIVPYTGFSTALAQYPIIYGFLGKNTPQIVWIDYTAGHKFIPEDISTIIAKIAAIDVLGIAGDAVLAGVASLSTSVDGLSESYSTTASATNATYGAHILQYQKEVDDFFDPKKGDGRGRYTGIRFV